MKLENNHLVLITGSSGEGKSFMAKKLVQEKIDQGYNLKEVDNIIQWREHVHWRKRQVVLIDDLFGLSHRTDKDDDHQKLIYEVGLIKDDGNKNEDLLYVIMTCRNSVLIRIKQHLKTSQVFEESNIVNLSTIELTHGERLQMIETHLSKYRENNTLDVAVRQSISRCDCPVGFPYCVYMFTTITKLFVQGKQFFISPIENVRQEVHRLLTSDSDVYALLVFLLIMGGEIKEETLYRLGEDSNEFKLLKNIVHFPSAIQLGIRLQSALKRVDEAFVMKNGANLQFRHSCVSDAMCISFSRNMEHIAIQWLPFDFIINRIRTDDFEKSVDDEIVTICKKVYTDLANRFVEEIELGNISNVCQHQALSDPRFVVHFIGVLEALMESDIGKLRLFLQVTEQENQFGALLNGSLLYWTSSLDMQYLCSLLLERKFYDIIEDKFWVQIQASAALVPACWYGFKSSVLQDLFNLGADINSSLHEVKKLQTHHCDYCTVHDQDGMTTIQASVFGDDKHKDETVKFLLDRGAHFKELSKHRPLIRAIKIYNTEFESGPADMNITRRTICTLLEGGADINWKDQNDRTAFWYIVINNNIDIARLLISKCRNIFPQSLLPFAKSMGMAKLLVDNNIDADFSQKDNLGKTLLHRVQHESLVQYFIDNNCSVQQRDSDGRTPIFYSQTLQICQKLIENGSSINTGDYEEKTVLHFIKKTEILECLLDALPRDEVRRTINKEDKFKRTPIFTCTSLTVLKLFMNHGADVNHQAKEYSVRGKELGETCQHNGEKIYNISLESITKETKLSNVYTANYIMNIPENYSEVPDDELEAIGQLTNTLCSENTTDSYSKSTSNTRSTRTNNSSDNCSEENDEEASRGDYTVTMKLALSGKLTLEIIQELKRNGADFNITDDENNTFIHYLLAPEHKVNQVVSIIETVLNPNDDQWNGQLVNAKNICGNTPLHLACSCLDLNKLLHSRKDVVATLLKLGADVHAQNKNKEKPLHCLLKCTCTDKYEISKLLQENGLNEEDVYNKNQGGELAIEQICSLQDQSKRFLKDAKNTILSLYKNLAFKDYLLRQILFFLKSCNISLIETVFKCSLGLSTDDCNEVMRRCVSEKYRLSVNSWVIMSSVDLMDKSLRERLSDIKLELTERHSLLKDCIVHVQNRTTRKKILGMIMDGIEDINATDSKGRSFLINAIIACRYRRNDLQRVIKYFLEIGSDPNIKDDEGFTAYHHCIWSNTGDEYVYKSAKLLSDNKASLDIGKPLLLLVDINRLRTKNIMFLPRSVPPNQKDEKGNAFHHLMIAYSKYAYSLHVLTTSISALIDRGVDINMYNKDGETPLHVAMRCQVPSRVIMEMLRNGADVNREKKRSIGDNENVSMEIDSETQDDITHGVTGNDNGRSAFEYMLIYQQNIKLQVVREMLKYGADPFHLDKNGQNSFHLLTSLVKSNCLKILLLLLKYCKNTEDNLSMCDKNGDTPLHIACTFSNNDEVWCTSLRVAVIRALLASGASINKANNCRQTPFHLLIGQYCQLTNNFRFENKKIIHNIIAVLSLFLSYKADMTIKDVNGLSVLDVINENVNSDLERFIQKQISAVALMNLLDKTPSGEGMTGMT